MAKNKKEITVEEKLRALYDLQLIDSRVDEIKNLRGELPLEVKDLEAEIEGLNKRLVKLSESVQHFEDEIVNRVKIIEHSKVLIKKYTEQQKNVRNNREFDSLSKEIEFQDLETELAEKHIGEFKANIVQKKETIEKTQEKINSLSVHLNEKESKLESIITDTKKEENLLNSLSEKYSKLIDVRLLNAYKKIRSKVRNGLAVVTVKKGASEGSFFTIPPQRQMEVANRTRIVIDEHSGRILVDDNLAKEERKKMELHFGSSVY